ncbi:MAG: hypothetical protein AB7G17_05270 [Phycisphaerales bacterium]
MADPRDIVDIPGVRTPAPHTPPPAQPITHGKATPFLSIWFRCCHVYARIYRNRDHSAYEGRCPRCGAPVRARIGLGGTAQRIFEAN